VSFRARILFALGVVSLVPLSLAASFSFAANKSELERTVGRAQAAMAAEAARGCERFIARALESVRMSVGMLPLAELSGEEMGAVLAIPYRQLDFLRALALLDYDGALVAPPAAGPRLAGAPDDPEQVHQFLSHVPLRLALDAGTAIGTPYRTRGESRIAVALRIREQGVVLAAEVALSEIEQAMQKLAGEGAARLVDGRGEVLAGTSAALTVPERALVAAAIPAAPVSRVVVREDGVAWLASAAAVPQLGWAVLVEQAADEAFRPAHRVRLYSAFWAGVAIVLIVALGIVLSRGLTEPIQKLSRAVAQVRDGRYDVELDIQRRDEIGRFADAFRSMAADVRRRDDEIRRWNAELQERVERGTKELRTAQDQILRTRRLAALGSLGAGMAHELNNPLTAVTGLLTLLREDTQPGSPQAATIQQALDQAFRMARIVSELRAFAEQERVEGRTFPLDRPVRAALDAYADQLAKQNIRVEADLAVASSRHTQGDPAQIQRAVANVVENAIQAMPKGGELKIQLSDVGGEALKLSISDTGAGIPAALRERIFDPFFTTKKNGSGVGMGLSVSHSIVEAHHGRIVVDSEEGKGATFTIFLPAAAPAAHLA
jgi:two-component system, NtrC family, sensor kinase